MAEVVTCASAVALPCTPRARTPANRADVNFIVMGNLYLSVGVDGVVTQMQPVFEMRTICNYSTYGSLYTHPEQLVSCTADMISGGYRVPSSFFRTRSRCLRKPRYLI